MSKLKLFCMATLLVTVGLFGTELPSSVIIDNKNGTFKIEDISFSLRISSQGQKGTVRNKDFTDVKSNLDTNGFVFSASAKLEDHPETIEQTLSPKSNNEFQFKFNTKFTEPDIKYQALGALSIPIETNAVIVDGTPFELPKTFTKPFIYRNTKAKELSLLTSKGTKITVTGNPLNIVIQDNRAFKYNKFDVRFLAPPPAGEMSESSLELGFKVEPLETTKVNLRKIATAGYTDDKEGDGKGGWTDQGSENDIRMLKGGTIEFAPIPFEIIDPTKNNGKGALILSSNANRTNFMVESATLPLPENNNAQAINLLHGSAWTPKRNELVGTIIAEYADGTSETIPVAAQVDCGDWWHPMSCENAITAWEDENQTATVGLYASSFALKKPSPTSLRFQTNSNSPDTVWMITSVTLSNLFVKLQPESYSKPLEIRESFQWKPLQYKRTICKGSPLDFSSNVDAPAGKYGFIHSTPEGRLEFEQKPGKHIRFFGSNICRDAVILEKAVADQLADYLVYCGFNSIRFHHHDQVLSDRNAPNSTYIDPAKLDKFEYLFAKLKEKGIYITTDFFDSRPLRPEDNIPFYDKKILHEMKCLLPIIPEAMENWKQFARNWILHKNPYTGMTWAEDPALYAINLANEENIVGFWNKSPELIKLYDDAFKKYCTEKNLEYQAPSLKNPTFMRFLHILQEKGIEEQMRFAREELKLKCLLTCLNYRNFVAMTLLRSRLDLVDWHIYNGGQTSSIEKMAYTPSRMMPQRIPGKPCICTEFNFVNPNIYRAEVGPLIGGYAALQDWDALYRFSWSHYSDHVSGLAPAIGYDETNDPMAQFSDRIAIAMFLWENVEVAKESYAYAVPNDCYEQNLLGGFQTPFYNLGLITKIGSMPQGSKAVPADTIAISPEDADNPDKLANKKIANLWKTAMEDKVATSSTGQLHLDGNKYTFTVTTPNVASITLRTGSLSAGALQVQDASIYQTVAAISLDNCKLEESKSVLIFQLTNIDNTGSQYRDSTKKVLIKKGKLGKLPLLIQKGEATIGLTSTTPCKVEALSCDGETLGEVKGKLEKGVFSFKADTTLFPGGVMAYHLTR